MGISHDLLFQTSSLATILKMAAISSDTFRMCFADEKKSADLAECYEKTIGELMDSVQKSLPDHGDELSEFANVAGAVRTNVWGLKDPDATNAIQRLLHRVNCFGWLQAIKQILELKVLTLNAA